MSAYLGIDIGGTKVKYGVVSENGSILKRGIEATVTGSKSAFMNQINRIINMYADEISGVGISVPGKVDASSQIIKYSGTLEFLDDVRFQDDLTIPEIPIICENDAKAATLGEMWRGNLKNVKNGVVLVLGTAVGGGLMLNRQLFSGSNAQAGEVSFMGTNELMMSDLIGGRGSAVNFIETIATHYGLSDVNDGPKVFELIKQKQTFAVNVFNKFCKTIALLIHNIQSILDVDTYVIAGGVSQQALLIQQINNEFIKLREGNALIKMTFGMPQIIEAQLHNDANLLGAVSLLVKANSADN